MVWNDPTLWFGGFWIIPIVLHTLDAVGGKREKKKKKEFTIDIEIFF